MDIQTEDLSKKWLIHILTQSFIKNIYFAMFFFFISHTSIFERRKNVTLQTVTLHIIFFCENFITTHVPVNLISIFCSSNKS